MSYSSLVPALAVAAALATAAPAAGATSPDFAPGHVVVRYDGDVSRADRAAIQRATGTRFEEDLPGYTGPAPLDQQFSVPFNRPAPTAAFTSSSPAAATWATGVSVCGETTSMRLSVLGVAQVPPMNSSF